MFDGLVAELDHGLSRLHDPYIHAWPFRSRTTSDSIQPRPSRPIRTRTGERLTRTPLPASCSLRMLTALRTAGRVLRANVPRVTAAARSMASSLSMAFSTNAIVWREGRAEPGAREGLDRAEVRRDEPRLFGDLRDPLARPFEPGGLEDVSDAVNWHSQRTAAAGNDQAQPLLTFQIERGLHP